MSTWIEGYTEACIDGKWRCIDFYQYDANEKLRHIPCIKGQSYARYALEWDCDMQNLTGVPEGISDGVRKECTGDNGVLYGEEEHKWNYWHIIAGSWFEKVDFSIPESCGFFPRQEISRYLSHPETDSLDTENMLTLEEYHKLDDEAKKAYQYYEYTDPTGSRAIIHDLKQAVVDRIIAYNRYLHWQDNHKAISLKDVRVLILEN